MMLMIVGPPPVFSETVATVPAGNTSPVFSSGVLELAASAAAGRLRGALRACGNSDGTQGLRFAILRSRIVTAGTGFDAGNSAGTHGAGGDDWARSRFATAPPGAAVDAGNSGGTHGAGTLPASSRREIDSRPDVLRSVI